MKALGVIPARLYSTRLPEKLIRKVCDKYILELVWENARAARKLSKVVIATDHERIKDIATSFGADVVMTHPSHQSGTDRVVEVARKYKFPIIVNIQGDEPLMKPASIDKLVSVFAKNRTVQMATLCCKSSDKRQYHDVNVVKVVKNKDNNAIYFSRLPIPYFQKSREIEFFKHLGIYAYRRTFLLKIPRMKKSFLEETERLEQLRIVENGYAIKMVEVTQDSVGIDTLDDLNEVEKRLSR
ncbi:MAG: 3-deoxy-manno-octulosonate cytidylyltransferase [Candidatus Omnitrophica bacterium]|nr:3-deoxy-manno-octulosonate cytidylyltransferase [Candidatus Omnitrophota bacterium]